MRVQSNLTGMGNSTWCITNIVAAPQADLVLLADREETIGGSAVSGTMGGGSADVCTNCGTLVTGTENFCANCGAMMVAPEDAMAHQATRMQQAKMAQAMAAAQPAYSGYGAADPTVAAAAMMAQNQAAYMGPSPVDPVDAQPQGGQAAPMGAMRRMISQRTSGPGSSGTCRPCAITAARVSEDGAPAGARLA